MQPVLRLPLLVLLVLLVLLGLLAVVEEQNLLSLILRQLVQPTETSGTTHQMVVHTFTTTMGTHRNGLSSDRRTRDQRAPAGLSLLYSNILKQVAPMVERLPVVHIKYVQLTLLSTTISLVVHCQAIQLHLPLERITYQHGRQLLVTLENKS